MASLLVGALPMASKSLSLSSILPFSRSQTFASVTLPTRSVCVSTSVTSPAPRLLITCGRGDKKTARGKRFNHSFGNARPRNKKKGRGPPRVHAPPIPPRRDPYDDGEKVKIEFDDESMFSRRKSKVKKAATKRSLQ